MTTISLTVHGVLLSLHQPYLPSPRPSARYMLIIIIIINIVTNIVIIIVIIIIVIISSGLGRQETHLHPCPQWSQSYLALPRYQYHIPL